MRNSKQVKVGNVLVGGCAPVSIQSMTNTDTKDVAATLNQINQLKDAGCQIIRLAVLDMEAAKAFGEIKKQSPLPMVADIHFDYKLAIAAIEAGADKVRINPGNIGSDDKVRAVLTKAKEYKIPIRIGVNSGSLEKNLIEKYGGVCAEALVESAENAVKYAESFGFEDIVVSLKSADVAMNHKAHKLLFERIENPLHIGLTEAGVGQMAEIKSTAALGALLLDGIGDTMRISLTGDPVREVLLAKKVLKAVGIRKYGIDFVSCPTCGRTKVDLPTIAAEVEKQLMPISDQLEKEEKSLRVAVMGCAVNGPGEAKNADIGVACGIGEGLIISKGEIIKKVPENLITSELIKIIKEKF
ncbi:MAG: flavodoxin-dependent (E)-4-hydroxy-3-methylbut-2-enyl-diphosphate synthase [Clostridia bacterium]|nr:flavodoxin-dependent (E)-4-hydroxy-3-methylbut-2-enyl-diphosphate synthase [Clostridia bacterium]